jgi:hypothetical protein
LRGGHEPARRRASTGAAASRPGPRGHACAWCAYAQAQLRHLLGRTRADRGHGDHGGCHVAQRQRQRQRRRRRPTWLFVSSQRGQGGGAAKRPFPAESGSCAASSLRPHIADQPRLLAHARGALFSGSGVHVMRFIQRFLRFEVPECAELRQSGFSPTGAGGWRSVHTTVAGAAGNAADNVERQRVRTRRHRRQHRAVRRATVECRALDQVDQGSAPHGALLL